MIKKWGNYFIPDPKRVKNASFKNHSHAKAVLIN